MVKFRQIVISFYEMINPDIFLSYELSVRKTLFRRKKVLKRYGLGFLFR